MAVVNNCPVCGSRMGGNAKACSVCGTAFEAPSFQCSICGAGIGGSEVKCLSCGADLNAIDAAQEEGDKGPGESDVLVLDDYGGAESPSVEEEGEAEDIASSVFVSVELEELVKLASVGPLRAQILFDAGYTDLRKLKQASVVELMNIRGIGRKAAGEIKSALREHSLEEIRDTPLTVETVGAEHQCPLCATIVSAYETSCYECGCNFKSEDLETGDSDRLALSYYDSKLLRAPDNKDLWYARGATLAKIGNYEQALSSFNRAIELDPSYQTAWMSKADVYNKLGDSAKAAECYSHIITSASGGRMPGNEPDSSSLPDAGEDDDLALEPPKEPEAAETGASVPEAKIAVAEPDLTQHPVDFDSRPEISHPMSLSMDEIRMDYQRPPPEKPDYDNMSEEQLKKELSARATRVKPYLKTAKEMGIDINHAKRLVSRAVTESKQNEFKIAVLLMDEGIEFAEGEFRRKISEDIENIAGVIRTLKAQGKDVSKAAELMMAAKEHLESGDLIEAVEKLKICLEHVESLAY